MIEAVVFPVFGHKDIQFLFGRLDLLLDYFYLLDKLSLGFLQFLNISFLLQTAILR